jgi:small conductance mechanosensitive channel
MGFGRNVVWAVFWAALGAAFALLNWRGFDLLTMSSGLSISRTLTIICAILAGYQLGVLTIKGSVRARRGAPGEVSMLSGLLRVAAGIAIAASVLALLGVLGTVSTAIGAFSGLILGWSLQAPVSGVAAWVMVSLMRPFRIGDRIQLPSLGLVGDVVSITPMYTQLNQVGGAVGSEEAVNRPILIPNAMLFSQVVINYTARQDAAFILDEVVTRITYDTDWDEAEKILIDAARAVTGDIVAQTGQEPYVRADMYDYGVYLRLRYMTRATDRPRITGEISKRIFQGFQRSGRVDFAIPFVYSYRKGVQASARYDEAVLAKPTMDVPLSLIAITDEERRRFLDSAESVVDLADRIKEEGLIQPVVLNRVNDGQFSIVAGQAR